MTEKVLGAIQVQKFINNYKGHEILESYNWPRAEGRLHIQKDQQVNRKYIIYVGRKLLYFPSFCRPDKHFLHH